MSIRRKNNEERCCGNCCWFYAEDTDGWGFCNTPAKLPEHVNRWFTNCEMPGGTDCGFVSRKEMRHHMVVLLKEKRWKQADGWHTGKIVIPPSNEDVLNALSFAYKYMKVFSKL